jgi:hypothetical protein
MHWVPRLFPLKIRRQLDVTDLADISPEELEQADEDGALAGNRSPAIARIAIYAAAGGVSFAPLTISRPK